MRAEDRRRDDERPAAGGIVARITACLRIGVALVGGALASACSHARQWPQGPTLALTIGTRHGHRYVGAAGEAPIVKVSLIHTIGLTDAKVRSVTLAPDGSFSVADGAGREAMQYDSSGLLVRRVRQAETGAAVVKVAPPPGFKAPVITCTGSDGKVSTVENPFAPRLLAIATPTGERAAVITDQYRIFFLNAKGDTTLVLERVAPAAPVSDSMWDSVSAEWAKARAKVPAAMCDHNELSGPASVPIISRIFYGDGGRLWVETASPQGARYDIFDPTGRLLATVDGLPHSGEVAPSVAGDRIALVGTGPSGVPVVRVYHLGP